MSSGVNEIKGAVNIHDLIMLDMVNTSQEKNWRCGATCGVHDHTHV